MEANLLALASTMAQVFGGIAALGIAFLSLLFERASRVRERAQETLVSELKSATNCGIPIRQTWWHKEQSELRERLEHQCASDSIDTCLVEDTLAALRNRVDSLRKHSAQDSNETVGANAKSAFHVEKFHLHDIERPYLLLKKANSYIVNFKRESEWLLGIPLLFCGIFCTAMVLPVFPNSKSDGLLSAIILVAIALSGLLIVFHQATSRIKAIVDLSDDALLGECKRA